MKSIFFDLETSDREPVGQILNFSFIALSSKWEIESELSGDIRLTRLQIPSPSAILANRIDVLKHQESAQYSEREASKKIAEFLAKVVEESPGPVAFVGYNSFKFDVPYLRTTLIRNGIKPYIGAGGKMVYRDLFTAARKLSVTSPDFPRVAKADAEGDAQQRLSLKLETLSQQLGLLSGKQEHSSRADVLLTIEVAKAFLERFGLDVRTYEAYEGQAAHQPTSKGRLFTMLEPQYDLKADGHADKIPVTLLDYDRRYSLWINLKRFQAGEGRRSVQFFKNQGSSFMLDTLKAPTKKDEELAKKGYDELKSINLKNFFKRSSGDIEQDIYRVDFDGLDALQAALWAGNREAVKNLQNRDVTALYMRNVLANHSWGTSRDESVRGKLKDYALYRYGGQMLLSKNAEQEDGYEPRNHPTLVALLHEIDDLTKEGRPEDKQLLGSLRSYLLSSEIAQVAGKELLPEVETGRSAANL